MWAALVAIVGAELLKLFSFETVKFVAWRVMIGILILTVLPIGLFKGYGLIMRFIGTYGSGVVNSLLTQANVQPQIVNLWGVGAYLAGHLRIGEGISIFISMLVIKFCWSLLPKWGVPTGLIR